MAKQSIKQRVFERFDLLSPEKISGLAKGLGTRKGVFSLNSKGKVEKHPGNLAQAIKDAKEKKRFFFIAPNKSMVEFLLGNPEEVFYSSFESIAPKRKRLFNLAGNLFEATALGYCNVHLLFLIFRTESGVLVFTKINRKGDTPIKPAEKNNSQK